MNSNAASILSFALSIASVFSFHGNKWVPSPKGSAPTLQNECQYAQANLKNPFMVFPATILFSSYHLKANGLSLSRPSYFIRGMFLKNSFFPEITGIIYCFYFKKIFHLNIRNSSSNQL